jgi:hypothetical protein
VSTDFIPNHAIPFDALRAFDRGGVRAMKNPGKDSLILSDGTNCLHAYAAGRSYPQIFQRCGDNDPERIIQALEDAFGVRLVSEYEPEYERLLNSTPEKRTR